MQDAWDKKKKNGNPSTNNFEWKPFSHSSNYALIKDSIKNINSPFKERYKLLNHAKNF